MSLHDFDTEADLIPLLTPEDEEEMANEQLPNSLAILPLRNTVLFPGVVIPITAGRDKSIKLINDANAAGKVIGVVAQKDEDIEDPTRDDIHQIGTVAQILRVLKMPDGNVTVILQGKKRFQISKVISEEPYINALIKEVPEKRPSVTDTEFGAIIDSIKEIAIKIIKESPNIPTEATFAIKNIESQSFLINFVSSNMNLDVKEKQDLLSMNILKERALSTLRYMNTELQKLELKNDIQSKVRVDLDQQRREYFLHQQMKTIQEELGGVSYDQEIDEMRAKAKGKKMGRKSRKTL
ncbi:LON peptidase substrate-binding domain-containing protein [Flavobacterium piscinae]|uniref:LON peptidase substrate-binding domain-containing protein n=1 Tax=Flavobacterium piscinae TaxID=2506424 RepID=UPI003709851B